MRLLPGKTTAVPAVALVLVASGAGCLRGYATGTLADALSASGSGYSSDDDPELVASAAPFGLKTMEQVLAEQPRHVGLLTALASGFTAYADAFVLQDADEMEDRDIQRATAMRLRARKLFLRAREYGLRGLEVGHPGITAALRAGGVEGARARAGALATLRKEEVPLVYWTAAAWTLAIASSKNDMRLVGELPAVEELMARAFALDETWDRGALHEYYVAYDGSRSEHEGGGAARAKAHLQRALALSHDEKLSPLVSYAEGVCVAQQDKAEFTRLLQRVLAFDVDRAPRDRLPNLVAQRRARWLLARTAELFAD